MHKDPHPQGQENNQGEIIPSLYLRSVNRFELVGKLTALQENRFIKPCARIGIYRCQPSGSFQARCKIGLWAAVPNPGSQDTPGAEMRLCPSDCQLYQSARQGTVLAFFKRWRYRLIAQLVNRAKRLAGRQLN